MFENYIQISKLNDFIFCPYSIYLHSLYENFHESNYHTTYQIEGKLAHKKIDNQTFSDSKNILQGLTVYSDKYKLLGKIDTFNIETAELVERKNLIKKIYDGYYLQLFAQYFCLIEMGYSVKHLCFYSLSDNKKYPVDIPDASKQVWFENFLKSVIDFKIENFKGVSLYKCQMCIYSTLCPYSKC